jgi:WD40 repeat protein
MICRSRCWLVACLALTLAQPAGAVPLPPQKEEKPVDQSTALSPDGKLSASAGDKVVRIFDVATQKELRTLQGHTGKVTAVVFSPDGRCLASGGDDKCVKVWDVATGKLVLSLSLKSGVKSITYSQDGKTLTTREADKTERKWEAATGREAK